MEARIRDTSHGLDKTIYVGIGWGEQGRGLMDKRLWKEVVYTLSSTLKVGNWKVDQISLYVNKSDGLTRKIFFFMTQPSCITHQPPDF